ncbi:MULTISPECIES: cell division protein ZapD [unclassified Gilliamella]|uniref:cell division protein ZapD n=1 Tax=unclassified Gilliamella TaxID=2685620 RepID=UPI00226ACA78|nr:MULTISPECIES: cell division protein ZapD [unclassified Gilliamella]MCX8642307.1 cell division protein ZapD [Gilliamella sp. B3835]MCX8707705.1 cell division protein ZapD [Gilliamella sp. B3783]MCX8709278.1 cell division protein ZapD [Gilliamella sp. B3780]MCX8711681.1 cell division protein ZapD [Gilliamella sp. B3468]MCX8715164.1 cell division protein ZapD [Gilliamella sp. B3781]
MDKIIFEHPLNEKMRTWLRVEFLLKQLDLHCHFDQNNALLFFHALSELLEIIERNDVRSDLIKEIESQKQKLSSWLNIEGVDQELITELLNKFDHYLLKFNTAPRLGQALKDDRFITSIRQRLMIPGGCCSFDLPSFYLWLKQSAEKRDRQVQSWLQHLAILNESLSSCMQLIRQLGEFKLFTCANNFFQETNGDINLIRIRVSLDKNVYPQVSGHMSRYSIRFIPLEACDNTSTDTIEFELACC